MKISAIIHISYHLNESAVTSDEIKEVIVISKLLDINFVPVIGTQWFFKSIDSLHPNSKEYGRALRAYDHVVVTGIFTITQVRYNVDNGTLQLYSTGKTYRDAQTRQMEIDILTLGYEFTVSSD